MLVSDRHAPPKSPGHYTCIARGYGTNDMHNRPPKPPLHLTLGLVAVHMLLLKHQQFVYQTVRKFIPIAYLQGVQFFTG